MPLCPILDAGLVLVRFEVELGAAPTFLSRQHGERLGASLVEQTAA